MPRPGPSVCEYQQIEAMAGQLRGAIVLTHLPQAEFVARIPNSERKPLRIWLHVSENDLGATSPVEQMRNWVVANTRMAAALKAKGYPHQFVFSEASGHVERSVEMQTMPEAFEWVWKGYKPRKD